MVHAIASTHCRRLWPGATVDLMPQRGGASMGRNRWASEEHSKVRALSLVTAHGFGLAVSILTPFNLVGKLPPDLLGLVFMYAPTAGFVFALGAVYALRAHAHATRGDQHKYYTNRSRSYSILLIAGASVALAMMLAGMEIMKSAHPVVAPAEPAMPIVAPASDRSPPTAERPPG